MSFPVSHYQHDAFFDAKFHSYVLIVHSHLFSFFANSLMSSMYIKWLIFSCDLLSLYPAVHFLSMWLSGIIAIMNGHGNSASPRNIPLWIFASAKLFHPAVNSTLQVFMVFLDNDFVIYLLHFETVYYPALGDHIINLFVVNPCHCHIFPSRFTLVEDVLIILKPVKNY